MERFKAFPPDPSTEIGGLQEIFHHPTYLHGDEALRKVWSAASSRTRYEDECSYPWDVYFEVELSQWIAGGHALDLGCFTGGRAVAWLERYRLQSISGVDVDSVFIQAANSFAAERGVNARFRIGVGEDLPFSDDEFDSVITFDVLEHVRDVRATLRQIRRVLRPGGILALVFPSYWHPTEHHLSLATRAPFVYHLFGGRAAVAAYVELLRARGEAATWYRRASPVLEPWERGHTLNGATLSSFLRDLEATGPWKVLHQSMKPIGSIGRTTSNSLRHRALAAVSRPLVHIPGFREIALHRVAFILRREQ